MAVLVLLVLIVGFTGHSIANWCVCKDGVSDSVLQKSLDYACGAGADCNPIHTNGPCFNPSTVKAHCNYAVNSYFQRKGQAPGSCDFAGTAAISTTDPSTTGCPYPASARATGSTTATTNTPTTTTTAGSGVLGTGIGPSGAGMPNTNTDYSHGGLRLHNSAFLSFFIVLLFSGFEALVGLKFETFNY